MTDANSTPPAAPVSQQAVVSRRDLLAVTGASLATTGAALALSDHPVPQRQSVPPVPHTQPIRLLVNGVARVLNVDPRQSLLDVLRERLDLTGTKKGCNQGACGACTVLLGEARVNSCLTLAVMHDGAAITTIEGLRRGDELHPLQQAFIEHDAFQCGYCTSGQIMSGVACITEGHALSLDDIRFWMSGNICRCGAYPGICAAVHSTAREA